MEIEENIPDEEKVDETEQPEENKNYFFNAVMLIIGIIIVLGLILIFIKMASPESLDDMIKEIAEKGETKDGYLYNGFVFVYQDELWHTQWQRDNVMLNLHFHYGPRDVENIPMLGALDNTTDISKFYLTFDPSEENMSLIALASSELGLNLVKGMNVKLIPACARNQTESCQERPIITCESTNESVIFIKTDEIANVIFNKNCIIIKGKGNDLLKAVDKFLYRSYKVIQRED